MVDTLSFSLDVITGGRLLKAVFFDGTRFAVKETPKPEQTRGEALIRVTTAGICATDIEIGRGYMRYTGIPGHEFAGVVAESDRESLRGARVVGEINCPCGACDFCLRGLGGHCPNRTVLGIQGRDGCFAEYLTLPEDNLHVVPESLSDTRAVFVEPLAAAYRIVEQIGSVDGKRAAVVGDGKLGLLVSQALASDGANVCLIGRHPEREGIVSHKGVEFVDGKSERHAELRRSFPIAVDCTGSPDGPAAALDLVEPTGTLVIKSTVHEPLRLPSDRLVVDEITVLGSRCGPFKRAIRALEIGEVETEGLIEKSFPLAGAPEAIRLASEPGVLKVLITTD
jgi:threonine dehydrogenase-like Zn-dependent dehydrogenase